MVQVGANLHLIAKVIGTETSRTLGATAKGKPGDELDVLVQGLADDVAAMILGGADRLVPEEVRVAMRILKNAGVLPPEIEALRELQSLRGLDAQHGPGGAPAGGEAATVGRAAEGRPDPASRARRMLALVSLLEARGVSLTSGAGLEYRRKLLRSMNG